MSLFTFISAFYALIIAILVAARFFFFHETDNKTGLKLKVLYDVSAAIHILTSFYLFFDSTEISHKRMFGSLFLYILGITLFICTISVVPRIKFASSGAGGTLIRQGPYAFIRHPFYASYSLIWLGSSLLFNSWALWTTSVILVLFYTYSARREEILFLKSDLCEEYTDYQKQAGMFLPRIKR